MKSAILANAIFLVHSRPTLSFHIDNNLGFRDYHHHCRHRHALFGPLQLSVPSPELEDFVPDNKAASPLISSVVDHKHTTELWLDLRSTAIHPKVAVDSLERQFGSSSFIDRLLLSDQVFQNLVDFSDIYLSASRILYHDFSNDQIYYSSGRGLSVPFGKSAKMPADGTLVVEDPIHAIEILSGGKWLILGNAEDENEDNDDDKETLRINALGDFLDIAFTAAGIDSWGSSPEKSGLVLPTAGANSIAEKSTGGGVAMKCSTKSAVMKLASAIQLQSPGIMTSTTDSGIILQGKGGSKATLSTALVLPCEENLWEVALMVFGTEGLVELD